jgi:hypothetical protein
VFAIDHGRSPYHEHLVGALVFGDGISISNSINIGTWLSNLDKALDGRFSKECLLLVLLAIIYNAKDQFEFAASAGFSTALDRAIDMLQAVVQIPYETGNHHWKGRISDVVSHYISIGIASPGCDFLNHPVDSFVLMIRVSRTVSKDLRAMAMFYRLLLHIITRSLDLQDTEAGDRAAEFCGLLRSRISENGSSRDLNLPAQDDRLPEDNQSSSSGLLRMLCDNHLMDEMALRTFRSAEDVFDMIENQCEVAICLFLSLFHAVNTNLKEAREILYWYVMRPELNIFFATPWKIHDTECKAIWESLT